MSLQDRLRAARHALFVGREEERAVFEHALGSDSLPFHVLYLHGPGGVGKTSLLREFEHLARQSGIPAAYLDARDLDAAPDALRQALSGAGLPAARAVLLLDTYEALHPLDDWLRDELLPTVSEEWIVVLAGRYAPSAGWRGDLGWQEITRVLPLRNLTPDEGRALLEEQGVPTAEHDAVLRFTHGHPLALSLVADHCRRKPGLPFQVDESPDVVGTLLTRFMQEIDDEAEHAALEAAATVRVVTEGLLADLLERDDTHAAFEWLRGLSFVEASENGLILHDLARETLGADLRWRRPERFAALNHRARAAYTRRLLHTGSEREQVATLADYTFLHRHNPIVQPLFAQLRGQWQKARPQTSGQPRDDEWDALRALVSGHEGEAAAEIAAHWFRLQPERVQVFRDEDGHATGFLFCLALDATTAEERAADPCAEAAWAHLEAHAPLRPGERATVFRFWMDREDYQDVSAVQSLIFVATVRHYLGTEGLAYTFLPCADPDFWAMIFTFVGLQRLPDAGFEVGGRAFGVYGHDWRAVPPGVWLEGLAERGLPSSPGAEPERPDRLVVLSEPDFGEAVRDALRDYARPHDLADSPLLRSRLVLEKAAGGDRVEALRALLNEAAEELNATPREAPYYLALDATYLDPARTQAEAAEQLDMPFSSFRRYLKRGIEHVVAALWQRELAA
ncbi:MAG: ATP-binding protein [Rhodothermales bacterium]